jgi:phenylalanine-4-hydroxylase
MESNEVLDKLPRHLMSLVIDQPYNEYTAQDHAVWRYVMKRNVDYLSKVAHGSYVEGLKKTGISIEEIPHMYGMNRILKEIGWAAVAVDGFIPPSAFMEFQAYNVLVIAADIRPVDQIGYTPAPDIIHEAAGHAPIIADEEYASYLRLFGEIGSKAFSSAKDYQIYEAIRHLSILKADPYTPADEIKKAERELRTIENIAGETSEMSLIRNLHWWTVEYGLIGDLKKPKIYGAGLLSSIAESKNCLSNQVKKLPYSIDAANYSFDITRQQPQLFVTPDFKTLTRVLKDFSKTMALKKGGLEGVMKAVSSENLATVVLSSGIQISGIFSEVETQKGKPVYIRTNSPTALSFDNRQLSGHGKHIHREGFGTPVGKVKGMSKPLEICNHSDLIIAGLHEGHDADLEFESGIRVMGIMEQVLRKNGKIVLITFTSCRVTYNSKVLFDPSWGIYDMAVGEKIVSAFSGAADPDNYRVRFSVPEEKTHKIVHSEDAKKLQELYREVKEIRQSGGNKDKLPAIWEELKKDYPRDWLLAHEIHELTSGLNNYSGLNRDLEKFLSSRRVKMIN